MSSTENFTHNGKVFYRLGRRKWVHHIYDELGRKWYTIKSSSIKDGKARAKEAIGRMRNNQLFPNNFNIKLEGLR